VVRMLDLRSTCSSSGAGIIFILGEQEQTKIRHLKSSKLYYKQYVCHHMYVYVLSVRHSEWAYVHVSGLMYMSM